MMSGNWGFEMACASVQLTLPAYRALRVRTGMIVNFGSLFKKPYHKAVDYRSNL